MKTYEKPKLIALSLSGNEQLCGSCSDRGSTNLLYKDPSGGMALAIDWIAGNDDGVLTREETERAFGTNESCEIPVESYCKFTATADMLVAWS